MSESSSTSPNFLTAEEVCEALRISKSSLYSLRHRGVEPASFGIRVGRKLLWRASDIDQWWSRQVAEATR